MNSRMKLMLTDDTLKNSAVDTAEKCAADLEGIADILSLVITSANPHHGLSDTTEGCISFSANRLNEIADKLNDLAAELLSNQEGKIDVRDESKNLD